MYPLCGLWTVFPRRSRLRNCLFRHVGFWALEPFARKACLETVRRTVDLFFVTYDAAVYTLLPGERPGEVAWPDEMAQALRSRRISILPNISSRREASLQRSIAALEVAPEVELLPLPEQEA